MSMFLNKERTSSFLFSVGATLFISEVALQNTLKEKEGTGRINAEIVQESQFLYQASPRDCHD